MKLQFIPSAMSIFASKMVMFLNKRVIFPSNMSIFLSKYWFYLSTIVIFSSKNVVFRSNKHGDFPINNIPFHIRKMQFPYTCRFAHQTLSPPCASPQLPAFMFWSQNFPLRLSAIFCMYLHVSSFSFNV